MTDLSHGRECCGEAAAERQRHRDRPFSGGSVAVRLLQRGRGTVTDPSNGLR